MKCSFCEAALVCKACNRPFRARGAETLIAAYQPDMQVICPDCQQLLVCKTCGFAYGEQENDEEG
jgi:hypothetical protein